jgi:ubiquinone/menaquinone biosynthesis C-methylase UbiE
MESRSPWSRPETVSGFAQSPPNDTLLEFADAELARVGGPALCIDIGCGAGRNAVPLVHSGWNVLGIDLSPAMLAAANARRRDASFARRLDLIAASMDALPVRSRCADLVVAHGIWNLARSAWEFRQAVSEASRVSKAGAALFVFTFSRNTLPREAQPVAGEPFVFTGFSGERQCFLTEEQLRSELADQGFAPDPAVPLREHNLPQRGALPSAGVPVIYEAAFRFRLRDRDSKRS